MPVVGSIDAVILADASGKVLSSALPFSYPCSPCFFVTRETNTLFRFGRFELDEPKRELRLSGVPQTLQPRVFDLLVYLVRNRDRVVTKDELLTALWPDVVVTDSSIMRAVSLIRGILREGDQPDAIQTSSRQGYRFKAELSESTAPFIPSPEIARARAAYEQNDWARALKLFQTANKTGSLSAEDFEHWARTALYLGQPMASIDPLEHAIAAYSQNADRISASRAAMTLANMHLEAGALAVGKGWHRRAGAFLTDEKEETREHGLYAWLSARVALFEGDLTAALEHARNAERLARRLEDPDVEALGLVYCGHVELATGSIRSGLLHLDEAGAAALAGTVSPWVCGTVFCSVIWAYLDRGDIGRAGQWTDQFIRWTKNNRSYGFPGLCHLHRGEVLCALGDLKQAETEIRKARTLLAETARYAEGDAYRVLGEIRFLQGDVAGAEEAFREAHDRGWHPMPGWALIQNAKGDSGGAIKSLQRALKFPTWADGQRRGVLLAHLVQIAAQSGRVAVAKRALRELAASRDLLVPAGCKAAYHQARAEVAVAEKNIEEALEALRAALAVWQEVGSRINVAHTRLRLAEVFATAGDFREAELEVSSAEKSFARMAAERMVERCQAVRQQFGADAKRR